MSHLPTNPSESTKRRNPGMWTMSPLSKNVVMFTPPKKRIRQSSKPLLNQLEQEWFDFCCVAHTPLIAQGITFRLANGLRYTPDVFAFSWHGIDGDRPTAFEVKGKWFTDDANAKLKIFAAAYTQVRVILVWKVNGQWVTQRVLP